VKAFAEASDLSKPHARVVNLFPSRSALPAPTLPAFHAGHNFLQRNAECACGGGCPKCQQQLPNSDNAPGTENRNNTMDARDSETRALDGAEPVPASPTSPACSKPGNPRRVLLQPVFFKLSETDVSTGFGWEFWLSRSNKIWGKLGVTFESLAAITIVENKHRYKFYGDNSSEKEDLRKLLTASGVEVFVVDNTLTEEKDGGGSTLVDHADPVNAKVIISDAASDTLLAHELGHVLGPDHPGLGEKDQIMSPTGSPETIHNTRNPWVNYARMTWPKLFDTVCLYPDA
jgi:hypothetical protein